MRRWRGPEQLIVLGAGLAVAEWLRHPTFLWVGVLLLAAIAGGLVLWRRGRAGPRIVGVALAALVLTTAWQQRQIWTIEHRWPVLRETMVSRAFESLDGELKAAQRRTEDAVAAAALADQLPLDRAFAALARAVPDNAPEMGIAILRPDGSPEVWAGRFRVAPTLRGDSLQGRADEFYVILETHRHLSGGKVAAASLLLWASPAVPDQRQTLAQRFHRRTGVQLEIYPPGGAPWGVEVFLYDIETTTGDTLNLFSALPLPPEQGAYREGRLARAGLTVVVLLFVMLLLAMAVESRPVSRFLILLVLLWVLLRSPAGEYLGLVTFFSSATFFRTLLGPLSTSAGVLAIGGALVTLGAIWLWRKRIESRWYLTALGATLLLVAPYVMRELGRGITPPSTGVPLSLWLSWQLTLLLATAAPIVLAAALFRGTRPVDTTPWVVWAGVLLAVAATVSGVFVWTPRIGWPPWYTFLWTPALFLVTRPAPRRGAVIGIAVVAGCAAALLTWGAVLEGRLNVARKDVGGLGEIPDPLALRLLELFGQQVRMGPPPVNSSDLYARWRESTLGEDEYPTQLGLWSTDGSPLVELRLDSLDMSQALISTVVRNLDPWTQRQTYQMLRTPGMHSVLLERVTPGVVMSAVIGPRTRLIVPDRLGRLLHRQSADPPLYNLNLSLPGSDTDSADSDRLRWRRDGWSVTGHRQLELPDGTRHVHAEVDLRGPGPIFVRGTMVVLLDMAILTLLWILAEAIAGWKPRGLSWRRIRRSYQARLALTLSLFFLIPAIGFAAWGFVRLRAEDDRSRDLVIAQTLRDGVLASGGLDQDPTGRLEESLLQLSRRINAELGWYDGGALVGTSAPVLEDLGILPPFLPPDAFLAMAADDALEVTANAPLSPPDLRMGYRVVRPATPEDIGIMATPQPAVDPALGEEQADLVLVLLLATLIGVAGALIGAQRASRALSKPVADLRRSALALGQGQPAGIPAESPPVEFEEVFGAFSRMAADVRSSQAALETARRRTAAVLANVATGVVALDAQGRILIANRRAEEILESMLPESELLEQLLAPEWEPLLQAIRRATRADWEDLSRELEIRDRRIGLQLTRLESDLTGVVVALNDLTDVTRAERVLAWGEMARQVAHEIKNPLTPLRLGIQHLQRVYRDRPRDFESTLENTSARILAEIDRLDTIARAFSRFGAPSESASPLERLDIAATAAEVVQLYRLGEDGTRVELRSPGKVHGIARKDEVKEVLVNLIENARNAGAGNVVVEVAGGRLIVEDNGPGMEPELLARLFEPRFSTTTTGSGLGLPIVRRLIESWGGAIEVDSVVGRGTRVTVTLMEDSV